MAKVELKQPIVQEIAELLKDSQSAVVGREIGRASCRERV